MATAFGTLHIAQVAPAGVHPCSGVLTALVHLAAALARRGHRVEVWQLSSWPTAETRELVDEFYGAGYEDSNRLPPDIRKLRSLGWEPKHDLCSTLRDSMGSYLLETPLRFHFGSWSKRTRGHRPLGTGARLHDSHSPGERQRCEPAIVGRPDHHVTL